MQEEFRGREKKLCICFVDLKKAFDMVPRKVIEWVSRKKGLAEALEQAVTSLYDGSRTKVRVGSGTSDEFGVQIFHFVMINSCFILHVGAQQLILYFKDLIFFSKQ